MKDFPKLAATVGLAIGSTELDPDLVATSSIWAIAEALVRDDNPADSRTPKLVRAAFEADHSANEIGVADLFDNLTAEPVVLIPEDSYWAFRDDKPTSLERKSSTTLHADGLGNVEVERYGRVGVDFVVHAGNERFLALAVLELLSQQRGRLLPDDRLQVVIARPPSSADGGPIVDPAEIAAAQALLAKTSAA